MSLPVQVGLPLVGEQDEVGYCCYGGFGEIGLQLQVCAEGAVHLGCFQDCGPVRAGRVQPGWWFPVYEGQSPECGPCRPGNSLLIASHAGDADSGARRGLGLG